MKTVAPRGLLIFDLDGTLMDTRRDIANAVNRVRADHGLKPLSVETVTNYVGDGLRELMHRSLADAPAINVDEAAARWAKYYDEKMHDETLLYPGVADGLRRLKAGGYRLALVSNKPREACVKLLRHFGIADLFDVVLGAGDTPHLKPHPEPLKRAMQLAGAGKDETWMIGDHKTDIEAARQAGVRSVFVQGGMGRMGAETPTQICGSFREVEALFHRPLSDA
jgi:phosphoglycolate phosphatase